MNEIMLQEYHLMCKVKEWLKRKTLSLLLKAFVVLSGVTPRLKRLVEPVMYLIGICSSTRSCFALEEACIAPCLSEVILLVPVQAQKGNWSSV